MTFQWLQHIEDQVSLRVLVIVYPTSPLFKHSDDLDAIRDSTLVLIEASAEAANKLILSKWPSRTILVFDLCNTAYNFEQAHEPEDLPVLAVHHCTAHRIKIGLASARERLRVNQMVAQSHKLHGYEELPMIDDHRNGNVPTYWSPRK